MRTRMIVAAVLCTSICIAQPRATVKESNKVFTTYNYSDPDPVPRMERIYPYFRFDGYTNTGVPKEWKVVELENEFIKVMILPEIGGKIWAAWEKSTGKPFLYNNQVVKFRDVAMRGPWTSGGIEANYGIIGHTPNCATPVDYLTRTNPDGSASCFIGTLDLLTQTYWTIEINLPADKAFFTTKSFWNNSTSIEQPYYTWMNTGLPATNDLQFIYPGSRYIGHAGEYSDWTIHPENGKDLSFYKENNFGGPKSYHVFGKYSEFFGAYYHDQDFGMARYSLRDEKPGRKIWIWGLSRNGMIWENLLTDKDGQYVEVQSGRLFNQASDGSNETPFKQMGFSPHTTDTWTEYWFPVKGTKGFVSANEYGALNLRTSNTMLRIDFSPLQKINDEITVLEKGKVIYSKKLNLGTLQNFSDSLAFQGNTDDLTVRLGDSKMRFEASPKSGLLNRPVDAPKDADASSAFALYTLGKEFLQQRYYERAEKKLKEALTKGPHLLPALVDLGMIAYRNLDYPGALEYLRHALSLDTYDPAANLYYGLANRQLGNIDDARDGFDIAALTPSHRGAAYTELSGLYFEDGDLERAKHYAQRSLELNTANAVSYQILAVIARKSGSREEAKAALAKLRELNPLNPISNFEEHQWEPSEASRKKFTEGIKNELAHESYLELADFYSSLGLFEDAHAVLVLSPRNAEVAYRIAYARHLMKAADAAEALKRATSESPDFVFPFRAESAEAFKWAIEQSDDWKPKYFLGLIYWSRNNTTRAKELFASCGEPSFAPFYAARAELFQNENYESDLRRAGTLDPRQWRYGKMLAEYLISNKKYTEAVNVAKDYKKRFGNDFRIDLLLARALMLNGQYKATTDVLAKTNVLPYEGATDGRRLYRAAWLIQAVNYLKSRNHKQTLAAVEKAKLWPENLGAGKPYDDMIDLKIENYIEGLAYERSGQSQKASAKFDEITQSKPTGRTNDLVLALALKKAGRASEGKTLLQNWVNDQPESRMAKWALAVFEGQSAADIEIDGNDDFRVIRALAEAGL